MLRSQSSSTPPPRPADAALLALVKRSQASPVALDSLRCDVKTTFVDGRVSVVPAKAVADPRSQLLDDDDARRDWTNADLSGRDFTGVDLSGATLAHAKLDGAILRNANLDDAELIGASLVGADLSGASARRAGFGRADLTDAVAFDADLQGACLIEAKLHHCDLRRANLEHAQLCNADLTRADLGRAHLREANLEGCDIRHARLVESDLRGSRLRQLRGVEHATFLRSDIRDVDFSGAYLVRRHIEDEDYLDEFRRQGPGSAALYWLWKVSSDCGRSVARWGAMTLLLMVAFGFAYQFVQIDYGPHESWLSPFYFSLVTLTTLGYGDAVPASVGAQALAMLESTFGYVMLGGLLAIISNKLARRAS